MFAHARGIFIVMHMYTNDVVLQCPPPLAGGVGRQTVGGWFTRDS